jgi:hypothetical protein
LYELATGNNRVISLAWDAPRQSLYAATSCSYVDRFGGSHGYREAKIHGDAEGWGEAKASSSNVEDDDDEMDENEETDENYYDGEKQMWPGRAFHNERSFGYALDCGTHALRELVSN